jgi:hypothetical protein
MQTHIPGSKVHEGQFCPALEEVTNDKSFQRAEAEWLH